MSNPRLEIALRELREYSESMMAQLRAELSEESQRLREEEIAHLKRVLEDSEKNLRRNFETAMAAVERITFSKEAKALYRQDAEERMIKAIAFQREFVEDQIQILRGRWDIG